MGPALEVSGLEATRIELGSDPATAAWLAGPGAQPHGALLSATQRFVRRFASDFDTNAWLGTHSLHLVGTRSFEQILGLAPGERIGGRLLDVGAGTGEVTRELAPLFDEVVTTEVSRGMARRLGQLGFPCLRVDLAEDEPPGLGAFSVVALLNVLDRAPRPATLLDRAVARLGPGARLLLATPLPMRPHVQGAGVTREPDEWIAGRAETYAESLAELSERELRPRGLVVERWAETIYRSQGDSGATVYELPSVLLAARRSPRSGALHSADFG